MIEEIMFIIGLFVVAYLCLEGCKEKGSVRTELNLDGFLRRDMGSYDEYNSNSMKELSVSDNSKLLRHDNSKLLGYDKGEK